MGLDKIKYHSVESPLTDTIYHNLISLSIVGDRALQSNSKILSTSFNTARFQDFQ